MNSSSVLEDGIGKMAELIDLKRRISELVKIICSCRSDGIRWCCDNCMNYRGPCTACDGLGEVFPWKQECSFCHGNGPFSSMDLVGILGKNPMYGCQKCSTDGQLENATGWNPGVLQTDDSIREINLEDILTIAKQHHVELLIFTEWCHGGMEAAIQCLISSLEYENANR